MHRLHPYPDVQVMFRRLLIATLIGLLAALAVALFRHAMVVLETLFLGNDSGSLVNAAQSLPVDLSPWPALEVHVARCEALDVFRAHYAPFFTPQPKGTKESIA